MNTVPRILLIEDDTRLAELIRAYLSQHGFSVGIESHGDAGLGRIVEDQPDLVLLDLMLPGLDGLAVCRMARARYAGPIIMLTAREDDVDQVVGLELGADDYVKKPVEPRVLLARIRAALRQRAAALSAGAVRPEQYTAGGLTVDFDKRLVRVEGKDIHLTQIEYKIVEFLARHPGRVMTYDAIMIHVWGPYLTDDNKILRVNMANIRRKLEKNPAEPQYIQTEMGIGYRIAEEDS